MSGEPGETENGETFGYSTLYMCLGRIGNQQSTKVRQLRGREYCRRTEQDDEREDAKSKQ